MTKNEQMPDTTRPDRKLDTDRSETHWSQASGDGLQKPVPKQFNELDESASSQVAATESMQIVGKQAYHDTLTSVDTDRGPVLDAVYNDAVIEGRRADAGDPALTKEEKPAPSPVKARTEP